MTEHKVRCASGCWIIREKQIGIGTVARRVVGVSRVINQVNGSSQVSNIIWGEYRGGMRPRETKNMIDRVVLGSE